MAWRDWRRHVMEIVVGGLFLWLASKIETVRGAVWLFVGFICWFALLDAESAKEDREDELGSPDEQRPDDARHRKNSRHKKLRM